MGEPEKFNLRNVTQYILSMHNRLLERSKKNHDIYKDLIVLVIAVGCNVPKNSLNTIYSSNSLL